MIDIDAILFYFVTVIIIIFFLRIVLINFKVIRYVKKNHRDFWEKNLHLFLGGGIGGPNVFQLIKSLDDPEIRNYKNKWNRALKQFFLIILLIIILIVVYIYFEK